MIIKTDINAGSAFWNNRQKLYQIRPRLEKLTHAIGRPSDLGISQSAQLYAITLEFRPTIIVELGRGWGNSTAVFTEAANYLSETRKVLSICLSNDWQKHVFQRVSRVVEKNWPAKLDIRTGDIFDFPLFRFIRPKDSVLFFWDAHGMEVAEYILGKILPLLSNRKNLVLVHDIMDSRYHPHLRQYNNHGIFSGYSDNETDHPYLIINQMATMFEEIIPLVDFTSRNNINIQSVENDIRTYIYNHHFRLKEITGKLGKDMGSSTSSIHFFSLPQIKRPVLLVPKIKSINCSRNNIFKPDKLNVHQLPLVSVVTPCFNSGRYLKECIDSVINQTYPNVEHVIQDGGSSDTTRDLLKSYSGKKYRNRVRWVSEKDNGQSDGLNRALQRVKGDIILVLNADDVLMPDGCLWGVTQMAKYPECAAVYGDEFFIDGNGNILAIYEGKHPFDYKRLFCVELVPPAQAAFIRTSMFKAVGLRADNSMSTCPDYEIWVRLGAKYPIRHEFGLVCKYRHHLNSEGQKPEMIPKMVQAKMKIINRILSDPNISGEIRSLKKRAYAGLFHWGANNAVHTGLYRIALIYLLKSFLYRPQLHKAINITRMLSFHVPNYFYHKIFNK